jgi:hypothetical protein
VQRLVLQNTATSSLALIVFTDSPAVFESVDELQKSCMLLKDEMAVGGSPRSLTVLPAFGSQVRQSVPTGTGAKKRVADKKALSWAETVKKQRVDNAQHSFYEIPKLTIELINW